jgi:hypothetical protein
VRLATSIIFHEKLRLSFASKSTDAIGCDLAIVVPEFDSDEWSTMFKTGDRYRARPHKGVKHQVADV